MTTAPARARLAVLAVALAVGLAAPVSHAQLTVQPGSQQPGQLRGDAMGRAWESNAAILFLEQYGLENFSDHYIDAFETLVVAQARHRAGEHAAARALLDALWAQYPEGHPSWITLPWKPFGINLGTPPSYYGLRMLTDTVDWHLANPSAPRPARTVRLGVLLVGHSEGVEPQTQVDLQNGTGVFVTHELDPRLEADDHRVVRDALWLFQEYVVALTEGGLDLELDFVALPDLTLPVQASASPPVAGLVNAAQVFEHLPAETIAANDWWWVIYPSHVPEQHPDFAGAEFITGGMGLGPHGSPLFIVDDRWLVRKPPHLGSGDYARVERMTYLPQWLQHEFYHHLYRMYPEFGLEATPHQWFDLATWPPDFVGRYEPDYYHESLFKRLQGADPPLKVALRYATAGAPWDELLPADLVGTYRREPVQNPWHVGDITVFGQGFRWTNTAPVSWGLADDVLNGRLLTGPDCPYFGTPLGNSHDIVLERDDLGDFTTQVRGFSFNGELYEKQ